MKSTIIFLFLLAFSFSGKAAHITGGEMIYDFVSFNGSSIRYKITLRLFRDDNCSNCAAMPASVSIGIFNNDNRQMFGNYNTVSLNSNTPLVPTSVPSCITNPPNLRYTVGSYSFVIDLPSNVSGYTVTYQTCCRIDGIRNVPNMEGATYTTTIPGTSRLAANAIDNSPRYSTNISIVCYERPFSLDFSAIDPDGDSLVYSLCSAYGGGSAADASFSTPAGPPYGSLNYINGYTGVQPLGSSATINSSTGIISGIAPQAGRYVVSVCADQFRRGNYIGTQRKDFIITVAPCDLAGAELAPSYITCDGFSYSFSNLNNSPLNQTYFWDFGVTGVSTDTSISENPTFIFPDTGVYKIKLIVNKGQACADSTTSIISVYPGFVPSFFNSSPSCVNVPVQFRDLSTHRYGTVTGWRWDFGDGRITSDTSNIKNPVFAYSSVGTYTARLIVKSNRGCTDTISNPVTIVDKPQFAITNDTLICSIDTLKLNLSASGPGTVVWTPNYNISNTTSFSPLVSPDVTTTYIATFSDNFGCVGKDTVVVKVVDRVTLQAGNDTTICATDSLKFNLNSDALNFTWTPAATLDNPNIKNPIAVPVAASTTYSVTGKIGNCFSTDQITIRTAPYPIAKASADTSVCINTNATLKASGGSIYAWRPVIYLTSPNTATTQVLNPQSSIKYIVSVRDTLGCPKAVTDTVILNVIDIHAEAGPSDTSIVLGQPLQLFASGGTQYQWTPSTYLSNSSIASPVSQAQNDIKYQLKVTDDNGCIGYDSISVRVFFVEPDLYVPSAFTPDKDGLNETFKPIPIGMKSVDVFKVFNRWGQLMYSSTNIEMGWDGKFKGIPQSPGTFVWYAEGETYLGKKISKKGSVILIR